MTSVLRLIRSSKFISRSGWTQFSYLRYEILDESNIILSRPVIIFMIISVGACCSSYGMSTRQVNVHWLVEGLFIQRNRNCLIL